MRLTRTPDYATSEAAAEKVVPKLSQLQKAVLRAIEYADDGLTDNELRHLWEFDGYAHSTIGKRRTELTQAGYLKPQGERDGFTVWVLAPEEERQPMARPTKAPKPPTVRLVDCWWIVRANGRRAIDRDYLFRETATEALTYYDDVRPLDAPHRVVRLAVVEDTP